MTDWAPQQVAIFGWFEEPDESNLVVRARAGTGKTTTILEGVNRAPDGRILLAAFNKRIAEELQKRIGTSSATAKTLHSVGYQLVRDNWGGVRINDKRGLELADFVAPSVPMPIKVLVSQLHTKAREMLPHANHADALRELAITFDLLPSDEFSQQYPLAWVCEAAVRAMRRAADVKPTTGIDFADMIFLPLRNGWLRPTFDLVVVDEAQDMNVAQLELARGVCRGRMAIVGDDRQAIYGFRGADSKSLDRLKCELHAKELPLTTTYRCGATIVKEANRLVPDLVAHPSAPAGTIRVLDGLEPLVAQAQPNDFVLSRKNAPCVRVAMAMIREGKRVRIEGRDIGAGLKALVNKCHAPTIEELVRELTRRTDDEVRKYTGLDRADKVDAALDRLDTLVNLIEGCDTIPCVLTKIDTLFADSGINQTVVSSVHRAKGLEAARVFVLRETLYAGFGESAEEENIEYVAITRAKAELVWVDGVK